MKWMGMFLLLVACGAVAQTPNACPFELEGEAAAKQEIARLFLKKAKANRTGSSPIVALLNKEIERKKREYKEAFGRPILPEEIRAIVAQLEANEREEYGAEARERQARDKEKSALDWGFNPVMWESNLLPESLPSRPEVVQVVGDDAKNAKIIYRDFDNDHDKGFFLFDLKTRTNTALDKDVIAARYFRSHTEESLVTGKQGGSGTSMVLGIQGSKGNYLFDLSKIIPDFENYRFRRMTTIAPYEAANGQMNVIIILATRLLSNPMAVFNFDPSNGTAQWLGKLDSDYQLLPSRDQRRIFVQTKDASGRRIRVLELSHWETLFDKKYSFSDTTVATKLYESHSNDLYLGINPWGATEIEIINLTQQKTRIFQRNDLSGPPGGSFVEDQEGRVYFIAHREPQFENELVFGFEENCQWKLQIKGKYEISKTSLCKSAQIGEASFLFYTRGDRYIWDMESIRLPDAVTRKSAKYDSFYLRHLEWIFTMQDGRIIGLFSANVRPPDESHGERSHFNFHLIQIYGPAGIPQ